ncbi:MFS transporter [Amycolatopsis japonica]
MSTPPISPALRRRVGISSYLGTTMEYYDFLLYGSAAALIFNKIFFANLSPAMGTIVALMTLAAGYVARLVGAVLFGHLGDRIGRKRAMLTTMVTMGLCSGLIGLLPAYETLGVTAPLLLLTLRLLQGLAVGGEYGGAVLMAAEYSTKARRGRAVSAAAMGAPSGAVLASGAMALVTLLPDDKLLIWGWRIPFVASFLLLALGLWFRARIEESPVYLSEKAAAAHEPRQTSPLLVLFRTSGWRLTRATLLQIGSYSGQGVFAIFLLSYAPTVGYPRPLVLMTVMIGTLGSVATTAFYAALSDRIGRRPVLLLGTLANAVVAYPLFLVINSGNKGAFVVSVIFFLTFVMSPVTTVAPVLLSELFDTNVRYTAVSLSYQLAQTVGSGFAPLIAASLLAAAGGGTNTGLIAGFLIVMAAISVITLRLTPESRQTELTTGENAATEEHPAKQTATTD